MRYHYLLFDADGTLFDFEKAEAAVLKKTFLDFGIPYQQDYLAIYQKYNNAMWQALEKGLGTSEVLSVQRFGQMFESLGISASPKLFNNSYLSALADSGDLIEGTLPVLQALYENHKIVIITNGLKAVQRPRIQRSVIHKYLSGLVISEEINAFKPSRAAFDATFDQLGSPERSEVLMIGDCLTSDIKGGIDYGLDTCWFNPREYPRPKNLDITFEIKQLGDLLNLLSPSG